MKRLSVFAIAIYACSSLPALAAATAEGASELTAKLQAYLGSEPGVVSVTVDGDAYAARIDFAPYFARIKDSKAVVSLSPLDLKIADMGGGKWQVDQDQSLTLAIKAEGTFDMTMSMNSLKSSGIFDEALGTFASQTADIGGLALQQRVTEAGAESNVAYTIDSIQSEIAMTGTGDNASGTQKHAFKGLRETISMPPAPDGSMPPMDFTITAPSGTQDYSITGFKPKAINELAAWLVAHPSVEAITASQAELKDKLRAALPIWSNIAGLATVDQLTVNTMFGTFGVDRMDIIVDMNGIVADGSFRESFGVKGLKLPDGIVPPFAASLMPQNFTLDFKVADFDLAAPAALVIDNFDLSKDPPLPPGFEQRLLGALLPRMMVSVGLGPSEVVSSSFHLKAEGSMAAGPVAMPTGSALVQLKGIDEIMSALQAAPPEMGTAQFAPMILVAKGMGKQEADGFLSWKIESTPQGTVTVNGIDPMQMGGGQ